MYICTLIKNECVLYDPKSHLSHISLTTQDVMFLLVVKKDTTFGRYICHLVDRYSPVKYPVGIKYVHV